MCVIFNSIQCNIKSLGVLSTMSDIRILKRLDGLPWTGPCLILVAFFSLCCIREGKWNNGGKGPHTPMHGSNFSQGVFPRLIPSQFHTVTPLDYVWICFLSPPTTPNAKCKFLHSRNLVYFLHCYIPAARIVFKI